MKNIPQRTCIVCRTKGDKKDFIRIVKTLDGIVLDKTGKLNGRGAYICNNVDCLTKLQKTKALNRTFKTNVSDATYKEILDDKN